MTRTEMKIAELNLEIDILQAKLLIHKINMNKVNMRLSLINKLKIIKSEESSFPRKELIDIYITDLGDIDNDSVKTSDLAECLAFVERYERSRFADLIKKLMKVCG